MKTIKTFEDACKALKLDRAKVLPDFGCYPKKDREAMIAHCKMNIVVDALNRTENEGKEWLPDYTDTSEIKYEIWWDMNSSSGSGFSYHYYDYWFSNSTCGSRLCFKTRELAKYAGSQFEELFKTAYVK